MSPQIYGRGETQAHRDVVGSANTDSDGCIDNLDIAFLYENLSRLETEPFYVFLRNGFTPQ
jgi:hypothetical protein